MDISIGEILGHIITFAAGGGLLSIFTLRYAKKKAAVEVKTDEIKALHDAITLVYQPLIDQQKSRIAELDNEVTSLRKQLAEERQRRQSEINELNSTIVKMVTALGMKANSMIKKQNICIDCNEEE